MLPALKLKSGWTNAFTCVYDKKIDIRPELPHFHDNIEWHNLNGKKMYNKNVILSRYGNILSFHNAAIFMCETLIVNECDEYFVEDWLNKHVFPCVKKSILGLSQEIIMF